MMRMAAPAWLLAEIAGFVLVGQALGLLPTLLLAALSALGGLLLLRAGGGAAMAEVRRALAAGRDPGPAIARGGFRLLAGLLLLLPGFLSDLAALLLLLGPVQRGVLRALAAGGWRARAAGAAGPASPRPPPRAPRSPRSPRPTGRRSRRPSARRTAPRAGRGTDGAG